MIWDLGEWEGFSVSLRGCQRRRKGPSLCEVGGHSDKGVGCSTRLRDFLGRVGLVVTGGLGFGFGVLVTYS